jgi:putative transposase
VLLFVVDQILRFEYGAVMPRTARASVGGLCYHVINRGNARSHVFHDSSDYQAFVRLISEACTRLPLNVLAVCLMPNHIHLVLRPYGNMDLSRWMQWLLTAHVRRHHRRYGTSGHVWQGRFKAFPVQHDAHLLQVMRYVERNALRANLVDHAEDWWWGSLAWRHTGQTPSFLTPPPVSLPDDWLSRVNMPESELELVALRRSVNRGAPFGDALWVAETAEDLGLESSLRPQGRPHKIREK